jgi:GNAT superfamily N-acetyltransferase
MIEFGPTAKLLAEVFPRTRVSRADYLEWLYSGSPFGQVIEANLDDEQGRAGHYALVPIALSRDGVDRLVALSLNTAVHERARGGGIFVRLASAVIEQARQQGVEAIVGVANANSTPGFIGRLGFRLLTPLPASVLLPVPGRGDGLASAWVDPAAFSSGGLVEGAEPLLAAPDTGEARRWTTKTLRWRLAQPGARYALHRSDGLLAVSCAERRAGVSVAVILKVFASEPVPARARAALVRAACGFHRAPAALFVGLNELVPFRGVPLPARLRPSPLNLIYRSLVEPPDEAVFVRFELLDFDAY